MAQPAAEAIGSMGTDTPLAVLSDRPRLLFNYFNQLFAQVTNPPLDAIREELVTSLSRRSGRSRTCSTPDPASCRQIVLPFPVLDNDELAKLMRINADGDLPGFASASSPALFRVARRRRRRWRAAIDEFGARPRGDRARRADLICCPTAACDAEHAPIPSLLLTGGRAPSPGPPGARAPGSGWSSSPATPARSTTSPSCSATAPARSTRTWRSRPSMT